QPKIDGLSTAGLIQAADGNLYGTSSDAGLFGAGTVYRMTPDGGVTVLHQFTGGADGGLPFARVIHGADGDFYGTTLLGGSTNCFEGCGTIYKVTAGGTFTTLYAFSGGSDGREPWASLVQAPDGNFYGTTTLGGTWPFGDGTIFRMTPAGVVTVIHSFTGKDG